MEIRKIVYTLSQLSFSVPAIAALLNVRRGTVKRWVGLCAQGGSDALEERPRSGRPRKLSPEILEWMLETVRDSDPSEPGNGLAAWTGPRLRQAVIDRFGVEVSVWTIRRAMHRMGVMPRKTPARPGRRAEEPASDSGAAASPAARNESSVPHGRSGRKAARTGVKH